MTATAVAVHLVRLRPFLPVLRLARLAAISHKETQRARFLCVGGAALRALPGAESRDGLRVALSGAGLQAGTFSFLFL
jgi:hypothetical protein